MAGQEHPGRNHHCLTSFAPLAEGQWRGRVRREEQPKASATELGRFRPSIPGVVPEGVPPHLLITEPCELR